MWQLCCDCDVSTSECMGSDDGKLGSDDGVKDRACSNMRLSKQLSHVFRQATPLAIVGDFHVAVLLGL
jgi:hypothetical protein